MSIPRGCVRVARGLVGEGCRMCVCSLCCWGRGGFGSLWSVVVFLLCASFPCVFLSQDSVGVARVLVLVGLGWFVCEVCVGGMGGWGS